MNGELGEREGNEREGERWEGEGNGRRENEGRKGQ